MIAVIFFWIAADDVIWLLLTLVNAETLESFAALSLNFGFAD